VSPSTDVVQALVAAAPGMMTGGETGALTVMGTATMGGLH